MIRSIFFATFDDDEGPKIHHQVPPDVIDITPLAAKIPQPQSDVSPLIASSHLFHFQAVSHQLIPPLTRSNQLSQVSTSDGAQFRILSHPVTIEHEQYPRNAFTFNICIVLDRHVDHRTYVPVVLKLATLFRGLEERELFLTRELARCAGRKNAGRIHAVCEILLEDLNNYSECMIPIDGTTSTLNLKLFPRYPDPPRLQAWQVPLLTVKVDEMVDDSWDLTLVRVLPFVNGVNSIKQIARRADANLKLVRKALRHLAYHGCLILLDIFSFSAIYTTTTSQALSDFLANESAQDECLRYITIDAGLVPTNASLSTSFGRKTPPSKFTPSSASLISKSLSNARTIKSPRRGTSAYAQSYARSIPSSKSHNSTSTPNTPVITPNLLCELYSSLAHTINTSHPQSLKSWCLAQQVHHHIPNLLRLIDLRRFITFGIIKGLLRRVHSYARLIQPQPQSHPTQHSATDEQDDFETASSSSTSNTESSQPVTSIDIVKSKSKTRINPRPHLPKLSINDPNESATSINDDEIDMTQYDNEDDVTHNNDYYDDDERESLMVEIQPYLDGTHSFDEICTDLEISERELMLLLGDLGGISYGFDLENEGAATGTVAGVNDDGMRNTSRSTLTNSLSGDMSRDRRVVITCR